MNRERRKALRQALTTLADALKMIDDARGIVSECYDEEQMDAIQEVIDR